MLKLDGLTALITGAGSGLGHALALALAAKGCHLYLVDRDFGCLPVQYCQTPANVRHMFACDLADPTQRARLIAAIIAEAPQLNLLVNCAGIGSHSSLQQLVTDEVQQVLQVNTLAPLELVAGLQPLLARSGPGCIVNIGSTAGEAALPSMGLYCASKAALHAFSRAIELELARTHLNSLLVILGSMRQTRFAQSIRYPASRQPGWYRRLDVSPTQAAGAIVAAMERGRRELTYPGWYSQVLWLARTFAPLSKLMAIAGYRQLKGARELVDAT